MSARRRGQLRYLAHRCRELAHPDAIVRLAAAETLWGFRKYFGSEQFYWNPNGVRHSIILPEAFLYGLRSIPFAERKLVEVNAIQRLWPLMLQLVTGRRRKQIRRSFERQRRALIKAVTRQWHLEQFTIDGFRYSELRAPLYCILELMQEREAAPRHQFLVDAMAEITLKFLSPIHEELASDGSREYWIKYVNNNADIFFHFPRQSEMILEALRMGHGIKLEKRETNHLVLLLLDCARRCRTQGAPAIASQLLAAVPELLQPHPALSAYEKEVIDLQRELEADA